MGVDHTAEFELTTFIEEDVLKFVEDLGPAVFPSVDERGYLM